MRLVLIEWIDSYTIYKDWDILSELKEPEIMNCKSVGFVIKENDDAIIIIPHISGNDEAGYGGICIPKIAIIITTELNKLLKKDQ